jgi:hypothetical protein
VDDFSRLGEPIDARPLFGAEFASLRVLLRGLLLRSAERRVGRDRGAWVELHAGLRPADLVQALERDGAEVTRLFRGADLTAKGLGVPWAGADPAPRWLDVAREFTEYWTHRRQIRHATGRDTDGEPRALSTVLDTFLRALPHTPAPVGTQVRVVVEGPAGGTWTATATTATAAAAATAADTAPVTAAAPAAAARWSPAEAPGGRPAACGAGRGDRLAAVHARHRSGERALGRVRIRGERRLAEAACRIVSIVR